VLISVRRTLLYTPPVAAAGGAWTPASEGAVLRGWWKADVGVTDTGGRATAITDQSGNGVNFGLSLGSSTGPSINATGFNSSTSLDFLASDAGGLFTAQDAVTSLGNATTVFYQGTLAGSSAAYGRFFSIMGSNDDGGTANDYAGAGSWAVLHRDNSNNAVSSFQQSGAVTGSAVSLDTNFRLVVVANNTDIRIYVNGSVGTPLTKSFTLDSTGTLGLGAELLSSAGALARGTGYVSGKFREGGIFNRAFSSGEVTTLDSYLTTRSGS
jgi:hypothetical protein